MEARPPGNREPGWVDFLGDIAGAIAGHLFDKACYTTVDQVKRTAKAGDMLEFHRGYFSHYALWVGNGEVMNIGGEGKNTTEALISLMKIEDVCKDSMVRIRNHDDTAWTHFKAKPKPVEEILQNAFLFENKRVPYEFTFRNCEYYSSLWRYGIGFSTQVARPTSTQAGAFLTTASKFTDAVVNGTLDAVGESELYSKYKRLRPL